MILIGGGAAGLFAAICYKKKHPLSSVILLEKTNQLLSKVRISGGGRCNVTHACFEPQSLIKNYPRGAKELLGPFHYFQPKDMVDWLESRGVQLKTESDGRMFPVSDSSETIVECLLGAALQAGVEIRKLQKIRSIQKVGEEFEVALDQETLRAKKLLLATGSSPWGHEIAKQFGHALVPSVPSLFTFNVPTSPLLDLAGIAVPKATLTLQGLELQQTGPLLLTHWGFSGPAALKLSAWGARALFHCDYKATLLINWIATPSWETLYASFLLAKKEHPLKSLPPLLPGQLFLRLLQAVALDPKEPMGKISNKNLETLAKKLSADPYAIDGKTTHKQEFVTAGGVDLKEIDCKTMQSRLVKNLFFAGEILNIDGVTGGFNFQNAWTSAYLAANA